MGFGNVLVSAGMLLAFGVPGFLLRKLKVLEGNSIKTLVLLLIFIAQPAMIADNILKQKFSSQLGVNMLIALGVNCAVILLTFFAATQIFRLKKMNNELIVLDKNECSVSNAEYIHTGNENGIVSLNCVACSEDISNKNREKIVLKKRIANNRVYRFASMFGNNGYFGLPLIALLFPEESAMLLYASLCVILFNLLTWTVGVYVLTGDKKYISIKKGLLTPVPIVAAVALPFFFIKSIDIPAPVLNFLGSLGGMTTPLAMLIMGARLAEIPLKELFSDHRVYWVSILRLLAAPAVTFLILKLLGITDRDLFNTLMIVSLVPSAVTTIVLSEKFTTASHTAVKAVLFTTIFSIVTIPLFCSLVLI